LFNADLISDIVEKRTIGSAYFLTDPYRTDSAVELQKEFSHQAKIAIEEIQKAYADLPLDVIAQNTLSLSNGQIFLTASLARILIESENNASQALAAKLGEHLDRTIATKDPALRLIYQPQLASTIGIPKTHRFARPALKLRYFFASLPEGSTAADLLSFEGKIKGCSPLVIKREISNYLHSRGAPGTTLSLPALKKLRMPTQKALSDEYIKEVLLESTRRTDEYLKQFESKYSAYLSQRDTLCLIPQLLKNREISSANSLAARIDFSLISKSLAKEFKPRFLKALNLPTDRNRKWIPLSDKLNKLIVTILGKNGGSDLLAMTKSEWVSTLVASPDTIHELTNQDALHLLSSMSKSDKSSLLDAGFFDQRIEWPCNLIERKILTLAKHASKGVAGSDDVLEHYLAEEANPNFVIGKLISSRSPKLAKSLSTSMSNTDWGTWDSTWFNTVIGNLDHSIVRSLIPTDIQTLRYLSIQLTRLERGNSWNNLYETALEISIQLFQSLLTENDGSNDGSLDDCRVRDVATVIEDLQQFNLGAETRTAERLPLKTITNAISKINTPPALLYRLFRTKSHLKTWFKVWQSTVLKERSIDNILADVTQHPSLIIYLDKSFLDFVQRDCSDNGLILAILCSRNKASILRRILKRPGVDPKHSLEKAAKILPTNSRVRAQLELMSALGVSELGTINQILARINRNAAPGCKLDGEYLEWTLPKKSGGTRLVSAPSKPLKRIQRTILHQIIEPLGQHPDAYGFIKGLSIKQNAARHIRKNVVVNCDIRNCFPSVSWSLVLGCLRRDLSDTLSPSTISLLVDIVCSRGGLPIGAPSSPALLNRVLKVTDEYLSEAAIKRGADYSRYADDLTFSGDSTVIGLIKVASSLLSRIGLELDPKKTNIYRRGRRQIVTGLTVNEQVSVPRRIRRQLRAAVHALEKGLPHHWHGKEQTDSALLGRLNFFKDISPELAEPLISRFCAAKAEK